MVHKRLVVPINYTIGKGAGIHNVPYLKGPSLVVPLWGWLAKLLKFFRIPVLMIFLCAIGLGQIINGGSGGSGITSITGTDGVNTNVSSGPFTISFSGCTVGGNSSTWTITCAGGASHNLLSATHSDTTAAAAVRGDGIFAIGATPTWQRLAHPTVTGGYFKWNGTDVIASTLAAAGTGTCTNQFVRAENADAAPTCNTVVQADVTNGYVDLSSNQTAAGNKTFTGVFACKNFGGVRCVDVNNSAGWAGTEPGAWLNAAITDMAALWGGGIVIVGPGNYSATTTVTIPTRITVLLQGAFWNSTGAPNFIVNASFASLMGSGRGSAIVSNNGTGSGVTVTSGANYTAVRDLQIQGSGANADEVVLNDNLRQTLLENLNIQPPAAGGRCVTETVATQGTIFTKLKNVHCEAPTVSPAFQFDCSAAACSETEFDQVYAVTVGGAGVGFNVVNGQFSFNSTSTDSSATGYVLGVAAGNPTYVNMLNSDAENDSTVGISILGPGGYQINNQKCANDAACIAVNSASANTVIIEPNSVGTTGANDITYSASSTGTHVLIDGGKLSKLVTPTSPAVVTQLGATLAITCTTASCKNITISGTPTSNGSGVFRMVNTGASGHTWDIGEIFGTGRFSFRDVTQTGSPAWSLQQLSTTGSAEGILSHTNTASRTYTLPDATGTIPELELAQTWSGLQTFTPGIKTGTTPPACTAGTAGFMCNTEGTAPTNVASTSVIYPSSTTHEYMGVTNGASAASPGMMVRSQPGALSHIGSTATISTETLCASSAGACNTAGQYHVHLDMWESGTACTSITAGSVAPTLTWTDRNGTSHAAVPFRLITQASGTALAATFIPVVSALTAFASADMDISTNGTVIQDAFTYIACTTGTLTYNADVSVTRYQ